ncbi:MAG TPA: class I mannose-6-phosphate isomerase [Candidatus Xenobia bacterium]|jgi:mannose-6-phosphate isomerase class I
MSYDKFPVVAVGGECVVGWDAIASKLRSVVTVLCVECYPGAFEEEIERELVRRLAFDQVVRARDHYKSAADVMAQFKRDLSDDPVFGRLNRPEMADFMTTGPVELTGRTLVIGAGASLLYRDPEVLVYVDMARWELQLRQRKNQIGNLGVANLDERPALKYKRAFFIDWRAADRLKKQVLPRADYVLDTHAAEPKMVTGATFLRGLREVARRPFRVVPFFDPGPWGGHWMERVCDLPTDVPNHAWCFDCVPEENSLLLGFGDVRFEIPSIDLVFQHPRELLGDAVHGRFGAEFPIRFDFLDTMGGGNLSLQVHPLTEYIQERFGVAYTQDESYYMLDAAEDACVYLGLKEGVDREAMKGDLRKAQQGGFEFPADAYVNRFPARKHDHFLIPAGTTHCSGKNSMVLEISATPYIFTFKLWDWGRLGLDGRPRPIHLEHGFNNIQWDRTTGWVEKNLVNRIEAVGEGPGWREERTGLHEREFIETRRHWFTGQTPHHTKGGVNVLNLVEGAEAVVESPDHAFDPFVVHYAETFIVPASVGPYTIRPHGVAQGTECGTIKAYVRCQA